MTTALEVPEQERNQLMTEAGDLKAKAQTITVSDPESNRLASEFLKAMKSMQVKIEATFGPIVKKAWDTHKEAVSQRDIHLKPIKEAAKLVNDKVATYLDDVARKKREEEARQTKVAVEKEESARLAEAVQFEEAGDHEAAEAVLSAPMEAPVVVLPKEEKVEGISAPIYDYHFEIMNRALIPEEYKDINETKIGKVVRALKESANIPGIRVYKTPRVNVRADKNGDA